MHLGQMPSDTICSVIVYCRDAAQHVTHAAQHVTYAAQHVTYAAHICDMCCTTQFQHAQSWLLLDNMQQFYIHWNLN